MAMVQGFFNTFYGIFMKKRFILKAFQEMEKTVRNSFVIKHIYAYHLRNIEMGDTMAYYQNPKKPLVWTTARRDAMAERTGRKPSPGRKHRSPRHKMAARIAPHCRGENHRGPGSTTARRSMAFAQLASKQEGDVVAGYVRRRFMYF